MKDESLIDERIIRLKKQKERIQTQKALLLLKGAQLILEDKFSYELALSVLSHSWKPSSDKQKEEWTKSAPTFRRTLRNTRKGSSPQSGTFEDESAQDESSRSKLSREEASQPTAENP